MNPENKSNIQAKSKETHLAKFKLIFVIIFSVLPLLAVISLIIWRCLKAKGKTNAEIRNILFVVHSSVISIVLVLAIVISLFATGGFSNDRKDAWVCAQAVVLDELKFPDTADFCSYTSANITNTGGNGYTIKGYVDAENGLGATVRTHFTVTLTLTSSGYKNADCTFHTALDE